MTEEKPKEKGILISCIDARLIDETVVFMNSLGHTNNYYHITVAGCAYNWQSNWPHIEKQVKIILSLLAVHNEPLQFVCLLEHRDCGAYKAEFPGLEDNPTAEFVKHKEFADDFKQHLDKWFVATGHKPEVSTYIMKDAREQHLAEKL